MPRRKPKHLFQPGQSGNPSGRPPGAATKIAITERVREAFSQLLDNNVDKLEEWLYAAAKKDPVKALDLWVRISERFVPTLQRTDHHIEGNVQMPINILMPNPTINLVGEGSPTKNLGGHLEHRQSVVSEIPEHYGDSQSAVSGEVLQDIPSESAPTNGVFSLTIPAFAPTERMLRETGEDLRESPDNPNSLDVQ